MKFKSPLKPPRLNNALDSNNIMYNKNILPGIELGIPLFLIQNIMTYNHYGQDISTFQMFLVQSLIGYITYGTDRFLDQIDYYENKKEYILDDISQNKKDLYEYINQNEGFVLSTLIISYFLITYFLKNNKITEKFIPLLYSNVFYRNIKETIGLIKPFYISTMWVTATVFLPCIIHDNNLDILNDPLCYLPAFFNIFGSSNFVDSKDITEDIENGYETIPVKYGIYNSNMLSILCLFFSNLFYSMNTHFGERPVIDFLFLFQNVVLSYQAFKYTIDNNE